MAAKASRKKKTEPAPAEAAGPRTLTLRVREDTWPIERIRPYERNVKLHPQEQVDALRHSYRKFGEVQRLVVDEDGELIAGHGRHIALQQERVAEVRVQVTVGWTEEEKRAYRLFDNQSNQMTGVDEKLLKLEVVDLAALGSDLSKLGFSESRIAGLVQVVSPGLTDPDEAPPLPAAATSRRGDVWLLGGRHRLTCGDSTNPDDVARVLAGAKPHLMVTDPPYGVEYDPAWRVRVGAGGEGTAVGEVLNDDRADWREAWALFPGDVAYIWHAGTHCHEVGNSLEACRFEIRAHIVWVKQRHVFGRSDYHFQHEPCNYAVRKGADERWSYFEPEHEVATYTVREGKTGHFDRKGPMGRKQSTVWDISHAKSDTGHGTQKPVEAMKRPIENNSRPGEGVYEPFSGSGTTLIAAEMSGRKCYAIELNEPYVDIDVKRWQNFTGLAATLEGDGRTFDEIAAVREAERKAAEAAAASEAAAVIRRERAAEAELDALDDADAVRFARAEGLAG